MRGTDLYRCKQTGHLHLPDSEETDIKDALEKFYDDYVAGRQEKAVL
jgi:hypothetical protein